MIDENKIKGLKKRRTDRFECALERIKMYLADSSFYKKNDGKHYIETAIGLFRQNTSQEYIRLDGETTYLRYFKTDYKALEEIIDNLREGNIRFIESDLAKSRQDLMTNFVKNNIQKIEESHREQYLKAVDLLVRLEKVGRVDELESDLNELNKDLISCMKYSDMIELEMERGNNE